MRLYFFDAELLDVPQGMRQAGDGRIRNSPDFKMAFCSGRLRPLDRCSTRPVVREDVVFNV